MEVNKTPISLIQEICAHNSFTPEYQLLAVEGVVHAPTFIYSLQVGDHFARASGQSKKKAKHAVAKAMIEILLNKSEVMIENRQMIQDYFAANVDNDAEDDVECTEIGQGDARQNHISVSMALDVISCVGTDGMEDGEDMNPVGKLQELCMKRRWRPPVYNTHSEEGLPHERVFVIECFIENMNFSELGDGKSKKLAKRKAALNMLKKMKDENLIELEELKEKKPKDRSNGAITMEDWFEKNKLSDIHSSRAIPASVKIDNFFYNLANKVDKNCVEETVNECLKYVTRENMDVQITDDYDICQAILKLAELINCKLKFTTVPELSSKNEYQSLVQFYPNDDSYLSLPVLTSFGSGETTDIAKQKAAARAFLIFKFHYQVYPFIKQMKNLQL